jgi:hypothetical protein
LAKLPPAAASSVPPCDAGQADQSKFAAVVFLQFFEMLPWWPGTTGMGYPPGR